jgi:preprotein translocase subunit SecD
LTGAITERRSSSRGPRRGLWLAAGVVVLVVTGAVAAVIAATSHGSAGGTLQMTLTASGGQSEAAIASDIPGIRRRLKGLGVKGGRVLELNGGLVVDAQSATDPALLSQAASTGLLEFRPVVLDSSGNELIYPGPGPGLTAAPTTSIASTNSPTTVTPASDGPPLTSAAVLNSDASLNQDVVLPSYTGNEITARYVLGPVLRDGAFVFTGQMVSSAQAALTQAGQWEVNVTFTGMGGTEWDKIVGGEYYQKYVGIVLDNRVESAPQINAKTFGGQATVSGGGNTGFTHIQASALAALLGTGALPVPLTQSTPVEVP